MSWLDRWPVIALAVLACRPTTATPNESSMPAPAPPPASSDAIAPPWQLTVADGNGNLHHAHHDDGAPPAYRYEPVTAATSSSGTYDGGPPREGGIDDDRVTALWRAVATLCGDASAQVTERRKGTVAITAAGPSTCEVIVEGAAAVELLGVLAGLPSTAPVAP